MYKVFPSSVQFWPLGISIWISLKFYFAFYLLFLIVFCIALFVDCILIARILARENAYMNAMFDYIDFHQRVTNCSIKLFFIGTIAATFCIEGPSSGGGLSFENMTQGDQCCQNLSSGI